MKHTTESKHRVTPMTAVLCVAAFVVIVLSAYLVASKIETGKAASEVRGDLSLHDQFDDKLTIDGKTYVKKKSITTILLMGIDKYEDNNSSVGTAQNGGQADFQRLIVIDNNNRTISQLAIDRDTLTPIAILGILGNRSGTRTAQISLSHGFGDGKEQSCELTVDAVSNLLLGTPIDFYVSLTMDGIPALNDWAGGVTVTLDDDFSMIDPIMKQGETITLMGKQAEIFTRSRMQIGVGTNEARMARQQLYISNLAEKLYCKFSADKSAAADLFNVLLPYMVTNMPQGRIINEVWAVTGSGNSENAYTILPTETISGTHMVGSDGFMQFWADESDIQRVVLDMFYKEVR